MQFDKKYLNIALFHLEKITLRKANAALQDQTHKLLETHWEIINPKGKHAVAVGLNSEIRVKINGSVGYYCGGMNQRAIIHVDGSAGPGVSENMMSGQIIVEGDLLRTSSTNCGHAAGKLPFGHGASPPHPLG